jgi:hypothetical protein
MKQCSYCQGQKKPRKQRLKRGSKSNFQTKNKTRLCDSKIRTQDIRVITQDVHNKHEDGFLLP